MISITTLDWTSLSPILDTNDVSVLFQYNRGALQRNKTYASSGGSRLQCVATADVNNDTSLDLFVANYGTSNIGVLLGYGNGDFATQTMLNTGSNSHPSTITLADFDGDSHLDIAFVQSHHQTHRFSAWKWQRNIC